MVLRTYKGHFTDVSLKNNTPVNTEVLWGGGLWWGLRAGAPVAKHDQKVINVDYAVDVDITDTGGRAIIATSAFAEPRAAAFIAADLCDSHASSVNTTRATGSCVLIVTDTVAIRVSPLG